MDKFQEFYKGDMCRYNGLASPYMKKFHKYLRQSKYCKNPLLKKVYRFAFRRLKEKHGLEISYTTEIGKGFYIGHPYNITINANARIGENCNIHKGATIGQENRGARRGVPTIGNSVWIGINATVVGNITIGDDVMIAPNSFVNCDVPAHSMVYGNPCVIKPRENATEGYVVYKV